MPSKIPPRVTARDWEAMRALDKRVREIQRRHDALRDKLRLAKAVTRASMRATVA